MNWIKCSERLPTFEDFKDKYPNSSESQEILVLIGYKVFIGEFLDPFMGHFLDENKIYFKNKWIIPSYYKEPTHWFIIDYPKEIT